MATRETVANHGTPEREVVPGKSMPTQAEPGSLEDLDITKPAPIDQEDDIVQRPLPAGREERDAPRPTRQK